jgi:hypothetical protein
MDPRRSVGLVQIGFFRIFATMMKKQEKLTHKEAVKKVLEELGGRARLRDIYPHVIPLVKYKPGSDIKATLRRLLQTTPNLFRHTEGRKGWWELVSYQKELALRDRKIALLSNGQITKEVIVKAFDSCDNLVERTYAKQTMQILFGGLDAWETAYKEMKKLGYFNDIQPKVIINNPQFGSLYGISGNQTVNLGGLTNGED